MSPAHVDVATVHGQDQESTAVHVEEGTAMSLEGDLEKSNKVESVNVVEDLESTDVGENNEANVAQESTCTAVEGKVMSVEREKSEELVPMNVVQEPTSAAVYVGEEERTERNQGKRRERF